MNLPISKCGEGQGKGKRRSLGSEFLAEGGEGGSTVTNSSSIGGYGIPFGSKNSTYKSGFMLGTADRILNQVDLVNYNTESRKVFINYEIEYLDGHVGSDSAAVLMSVTGCEVKKGAIHLDKTGVAETESPKFPVTKDGMIVAASKFFKENPGKIPNTYESRSSGSYVGGPKILTPQLCFY
jgi:hypothetical protein